MGIFNKKKKFETRDKYNSQSSSKSTPNKYNSQNNPRITRENTSSSRSEEYITGSNNDDSNNRRPDEMNQETSTTESENLSTRDGSSNGFNKETENNELVYHRMKPYSEKFPVNHVIGETQVIAIINQKGGVGKTTTALNLSAALGEQNKEVLLVDLDPQGNATSGLGIEKNQVKYCVYDALLNDVPLEQMIIPDVYKGLDLVPATINLAGAEVELVTAIARENRLKDAIGKFRGKYDFIIIDCPPSLGLLTINSFVAADSLIIPIQTEFYALEGVTKLLESMKLVKSRLNPALEIYGVVLTMFDARTTLAKQVAYEVRNYFQNKVFDTEIPRTVRLSEAPSFGQPITQYEPDGKGARAYTKLAKEVIENGN